MLVLNVINVGYQSLNSSTEERRKKTNHQKNQQNTVQHWKLNISKRNTNQSLRNFPQDTAESLPLQVYSQMGKGSILTKSGAGDHIEKSLGKVSRLEFIMQGDDTEP